MTNDPFMAGGVAQWGSQMVQAWQRGLETWWNTLLNDSNRLGELARRLGEMGLGRSAPGQAGLDPAAVLQALELMERRLTTLEEQVRDLLQQKDGD